MIALPLVLLAAASSGAVPKVAVLVSARSPADAAELEQAIETRLSSMRDLQVLSGDQVAGVLGVEEPASAGIDPAAKAKADRLWDQARQAWIEADYPAALKALDDLSALVEKLPAAERIRAHELGAAVHVKQEDLPAARKEAAAALVAAGELPADVDDYPPSVRKVFEEAAASLKKVTLAFEDLPAHAVVTVDDRPVTGASVVLPVGLHRVLVKAKGFRTIQEDVEVADDQSMPIAPAPALDPPTDRLLSTVVLLQTPPSPEQMRALDELAGKLSVDALVVAVKTLRAKRASIWWAAPRRKLDSLGTFDPGVEGDGALAERLASGLEETLHPVVVQPPSGVSVAPVAVPWSFDLRGGLGVSFRHRAVSGQDGNGFALDFTGVGPRVSAVASRRWFTAELELWPETFALAPNKVNLPAPQTGTATVNGSTDLRGRAAVGFRWNGAPRAGGQHWTAGVMAEAVLDQWQGADPSDSSGTPMGLNPSQTYFTGLFRVETEIPVSPKVALSGAVHVFPIAPMKDNSGLHESPGGTTGNFNDNNCNGSCKDGTSGGFLELGGSYALSGPWILRADLLYEDRVTQWLGQATAPFSPVIRNAKDEVTTEALILGVQTRF